MFNKYMRNTPSQSSQSHTIYLTRSWWALRPLLIAVLGLFWVACLAIVVLNSTLNRTQLTSSYIITSKGFKVSGFQERWPHDPAPAAQSCAASSSLPPPEAVQKQFAEKWGHTCVSLRQACYDQGSFVVYGSAHNPHKGGKAPLLEALKLGNNHLDFREFGDGIGIMQYPEIIMRPGGSDEETPDLRHPLFSNCSRPVVFYLNHIFMFGDFMIRTMPAFINALQSGAWDTDYTIVLATGGQKLDTWQKLMLQPLTKHPIVTLSAASSRALAFLPGDVVMPHYDDEGSTSSSSWHQSGRGLKMSAASSSSSTASASQQQQQQQQRPWKKWKQRSYTWKQKLGKQQQQPRHPQQQQSSTTTKIRISIKPQQQQQLKQEQWQQWQQRWQVWKQQHQLPAAPSSQQQLAANEQGRSSLQQQHLELGVAATPPVTTYGRCFESLTVCSVQGPKGFPDRLPREVWSGAQYIKDYWVQAYGDRYKQLQPAHEAMQQPDAFRVVFAVRGNAAVRSILNLQELLDWCNAWAPRDKDDQAVGKYKHTVCVAHDFGRHGQVHTNTQQPHKAVPAAAAAAGTAAGSAGTRSSSSSSVGQGFLAQLHESVAEGVGALTAFLSGRYGRELHSTRNIQQLHAAAAYAAAASGSAASSLPHARSMQQQQQQQVDGTYQADGGYNYSDGRPGPGSEFDRPADLPSDPQLDPRALLADIALLEQADVVVGLHGAQLYNALFMPAHKSLVEFRPYQFTGGWPDQYFKDPLVVDDESDGIFWWGVDTVTPANSKPGKWEEQRAGCCHPRDRHTRIETKALDYVFRRILWANEDRERYKELTEKNENYITDTVQPAEQYHTGQEQAKKQQQQQQGHEVHEQQVQKLSQQAAPRDQQQDSHQQQRLAEQEQEHWEQQEEQELEEIERDYPQQQQGEQQPKNEEAQQQQQQQQQQQHQKQQKQEKEEKKKNPGYEEKEEGTQEQQQTQHDSWEQDFGQFVEHQQQAVQQLQQQHDEEQQEQQAKEKEAPPPPAEQKKELSNEEEYLLLAREFIAKEYAEDQ